MVAMYVSALVRDRGRVTLTLTMRGEGSCYLLGGLLDRARARVRVRVSVRARVRVQVRGHLLGGLLLGLDIRVSS